MRSLLVWLKWTLATFSMTARVSEVKDNETDNKEHNVKETDYCDDGINETDEVESTIKDCKIYCHNPGVLYGLIKQYRQLFLKIKNLLKLVI